MNDLFRRELAAYADAHRDRVNGVMHIIGNPLIFIGVVLPLSLVPVTVHAIEVSLAPLLTIPALLLWTIWDVGLGLAIVVSSVPLLLIAAAIAQHVSVTAVWIIAIALFVIGWALQIVGHRIFERNWPSLIDDPLHMLISPMYIFARLFIAFGLRPDLAVVVQQSSPRTAHDSPPFPGEAGADVGQHP